MVANAAESVVVAECASGKREEMDGHNNINNVMVFIFFGIVSSKDQ